VLGDFPVLSYPLLDIVLFAFDDLVSVGEFLSFRLHTWLHMFTSMFALKIVFTKSGILIAISAPSLSTVDIFHQFTSFCLFTRDMLNLVPSPYPLHRA
jgi:hypothetical protein